MSVQCLLGDHYPSNMVIMWLEYMYMLNIMGFTMRDNDCDIDSVKSIANFKVTQGYI